MSSAAHLLELVICGLLEDDCAFKRIIVKQKTKNKNQKQKQSLVRTDNGDSHRNHRRQQPRLC